MPNINVNNAEFYYEIEGQGQPLVFIAGYSGDHTMWAMQVAELKEHFQILTFDNRAVGQTKDDGSVITAEKMADDVAALMDALNIEKAHIIGSSMGGTIAQAFALRHPQKVNKLGLMVTAAKWRNAMLKVFFTNIAIREAELPFEVSFELVLGMVFGDEFLSRQENVDYLREMFLNAPYPQSLEDQKRQGNVLVNFDSRDQLSQIKAPTLVMNGKHDMLSMPHESEFLAEAIPDAKLHTFDCGHAVPAEKPEELNQVILDFLQ